MSFVESLETLFPCKGMVVEAPLNFLKACFLGNSTEEWHF